MCDPVMVRCKELGVLAEFQNLCAFIGFCDGLGWTTRWTFGVIECRFKIFNFYPTADSVRFSIPYIALGTTNLKTSGWGTTVAIAFNLKQGR